MALNKVFLCLIASVFLLNCHRYDLLEKIENPGGSASCADNGTGIVKNGLIAWWNFNGNLSDRWDCGSGFQPAMGSNFTFTNDRFGQAGKAIDLGGGTGIVNLGSQSEFQTAPFTLCTWVKMSLGGQYDAIKRSTGSNGYALEIRDISTSISVKMNGTTTVFVGAGMGTNVWNYMCLVYDAANHQGFVGPFNGSLLSTGTSATAFAQTGVSTDLLTNANQTAYDDAVFYNRKLSQEEITRNFAAAEQ